jgi:subtilase family serine protease
LPLARLFHWVAAEPWSSIAAYDYATAYDDLKVFSRQLNLPVLQKCTNGVTTSCLQVAYATGSRPSANCGWAQEAALDIEWAHDMAPNAKIVLVGNLAGSGNNSTDTELSTIYACYATPSCYSSNFRDITSGTAGGFTAVTGSDFVTGVGSVHGKVGK